jgi:Fic family protein
MIKYKMPESWIKYDKQLVAEALAEAKASVIALQTTPYQRDWVEDLQEMELKREVAGTSRIEGADFSEKELDIALTENPQQLWTRSQKQALAAKNTYRWITTVADDLPLTRDLIFDVHRRIVTGADDDHCEPGKLRVNDQNVTFGAPRHRGAEGGEECYQAFLNLENAINSDFKDHDPLIQALAIHYHFGAIHPFLDGNGRTARALEALILQRAGLRDVCFIAMSNYYYDEKQSYLTALSQVQKNSHDLTPFLIFGLNGVAKQSRRVLSEIQTNVKKALFRNLMYDLFGRLKTPRKRVIAERQIKILQIMLREESIDLNGLFGLIEHSYVHLNNPWKAYIRDLNGLINLKTIMANRDSKEKWFIEINLNWPMIISETEFFEVLRNLPKAKSNPLI